MGSLTRRWKAPAAVLAAITGSLLGIDGVIVNDGSPQMQSARTTAASSATIRRAIRLVVKSRRRLVREAICGCLSVRPDFSIVGQVASVDALAELCTLRRPDAALVDTVELTVRKVDVLRRVRSVVPDTALVVTYAETSPQALEVAAAGGITRLVPSSRGLDAVLRMVRESARPARRRPPDGLALTDYDLRVASLLSAGHGARDMADVLQISPHTVENHKRRLYAKLGVTSSSHAVSRAVSLGMIGQPSVQPPEVQDGRAPLAVVHGADGAGVNTAMLALIAAGLPVVRPGAAADPHRDHCVRWQRGPVVTVLVDPAHDDWLAPAIPGAYPLVVLSKQPDAATLVEGLQRGARAVVHIDGVAADLAAVLFLVVRGHLVVDSAQLEHLHGWMTGRIGADSPAAPLLTRREREILSLLALGNTIRQTAHALGVTAKTVENAQGHLLRKLGARNRAEAVALAYRLGMLDLDP